MLPESRPRVVGAAGMWNAPAAVPSARSAVSVTPPATGVSSTTDDAGSGPPVGSGGAAGAGACGCGAGAAAGAAGAGTLASFDSLKPQEAQNLLLDGFGWLHCGQMT